MARTLPDYEVIVSNVGTVYGGPSKQMAEKTYYDYIEISRSGRGRAGGEEVSLFVDGEFVDGYVPEHKSWGRARAALSSAVRLPKRKSNPPKARHRVDVYAGGDEPVESYPFKNEATAQWEFDYYSRKAPAGVEMRLFLNGKEVERHPQPEKTRRSSRKPNPPRGKVVGFFTRDKLRELRDSEDAPLMCHVFAVGSGVEVRKFKTRADAYAFCSSAKPVIFSAGGIFSRPYYWEMLVPTTPSEVRAFAKNPRR